MSIHLTINTVMKDPAKPRPVVTVFDPTSVSTFWSLCLVLLGGLQSLWATPAALLCLKSLFFCCQQDFFHCYIIHNSVLHFHTALLQCKSPPPHTHTHVRALRRKNRFDFWTSFRCHIKAPDSYKPWMLNLTKAKCDSVLITAGVSVCVLVRVPPRA